MVVPRHLARHMKLYWRVSEHQRCKVYHGVYLDDLQLKGLVIEERLEESGYLKLEKSYSVFCLHLVSGGGHVLKMGTGGGGKWSRG